MYNSCWEKVLGKPQGVGSEGELSFWQDHEHKHLPQDNRIIHKSGVKRPWDISRGPRSCYHLEPKDSCSRDKEGKTNHFLYSLTYPLEIVMMSIITLLVYTQKPIMEIKSVFLLYTSFLLL